MLSMMVNEDFNVYYDWKNCRINIQMISGRLKRLSELKYSNNLVEILNKMLKRDSFERPDLADQTEMINTQISQMGHTSYGQSGKLMNNPQPGRNFNEGSGRKADTSNYGMNNGMNGMMSNDSNTSYGRSGNGYKQQQGQGNGGLNNNPYMQNSNSKGNSGSNGNMSEGNGRMGYSNQRDFR